MPLIYNPTSCSGTPHLSRPFEIAKVGTVWPLRQPLTAKPELLHVLLLLSLLQDT